MANINSVKQVELFPDNRPTTGNTWSYRNGNPTLTYTFGVNDNAYLLSHTLRLNFTVSLRQSAGTLPNNGNATGAGVATVLQNSKVGAMSCFQSIVISNSLNQTLERVTNFPRLLSSIVASTSNFHDYANHLGLELGATSSALAQARLDNQPKEVCARVLAGMFLMGAAIPLGGSGKGTSGLQIKFNLAPSIEANFGDAAAQGSYYEISNPSLTCQLGLVAGGLPTIKNMPYTSFSSYYAVVNNSDVTQNINCGLSDVISVFTNFVPTSHIANSTQDGNETNTLLNNSAGAPTTFDQYAPISRYTTMRGGLKYPYQFGIDEAKNITSAGTTFTANYTAQRERNFLSALSPIKDRVSTLAGNLSEGGLGVPNIPAPENTEKNTQGGTILIPGVKAGHVYGLGARMDGLGIGQGTNFKNATFSHRIQSKLNGVSANSAYTFFLHKNNISYGGGGIAVSN